MRLFLTTIAALFLLVGVAFAGSTPDPNTADKSLGKAGKLRYASDSDPLKLSNSGYAFPIAGCGPETYNTVGGGVRMPGPDPGTRRIAGSKPFDWYDTDSLPEDGWSVSGFGGSAGKLTSYAICAKGVNLEYKSGTVPEQPKAVRTFGIACPGDTDVIGGGSQIATSQSYINSSYPYDNGDKGKAPNNGWAVRVFDTIGGSGGFQVFAICAKQEKVSYKTATAKKLKSNHASNQKLSCPKGEHAVSGGSKVSGPGDGAHLEGSYPFDSGDKGKVPDDGFKLSTFNDHGSKKNVRSTLICLG